jgi:hypothetical protein
MLITRFALLGALTFLPAFGQVQGEEFSPDAAVRVAPHRLHPIRDKFDHGNGTAESTNWSGYAVTGSSFTSAQASWVVPAVNCTGVKGDQYAAFWVGLDGYSSATVEQTGTLSYCVGARAGYYTWFEFYPNPMYEILTVPVNAGNLISASVVYNGKKFTATITNLSLGRSYSVTSAGRDAARSSAEWIAEAPCCTNSGGILPMADFGTGLFGYDSTQVTGTNYTTDSSNSGPIGSFLAVNQTEINKSGSSTSPQTSTCSALSSDGTSFSCTWAQ